MSVPQEAEQRTQSKPAGAEAPGGNGKPAETDELSGTLLETLRDKRKAIGQDRRYSLEIPGYDGKLVAQYKVVPWDEMKRLADKLDKSQSPRKELLAQVDTLLMACVQILARDGGEDKPLQEVFPEIGDEPIRFDERLAKVLGFEPDSGSPARSIVFKTFDNDIAITSHHQKVAEWMESSRSDDEKDF
jgi:hypothetical protein